MNNALQKQREPLGDLVVESVKDDGAVVLRLPGGGAFSIEISRELVPYYRRLAVDANAK